MGEGRLPQRGGGAGEPLQVDVAAEVSATRGAQAAWAALSLQARTRVFRRLRHEIAERADDLCAAVEGTNERRPGETLTAEVVPLADACRFIQRKAARLLAPRRLGRRGRPAWLTGVRAEIRREPFGVVLVIGPSNYPLLLPGVQSLHALAAGNAVVLKPGAGGQSAAEALADCLHAAGLDPALCCVLPESAGAAESAIEAGVDKVVLTGSAPTGRAVLAQLAPRLVPATMELSGCDAAFVLDDADMGLVVDALQFGLQLNRARTCMSPRRVFVMCDRAEELAQALAAAARAGETVPVDGATGERLRGLVREALDQGASLVAGDVGDPQVRGPLILADASPEMRLLREDVMAPVLSLVDVRDANEALTAAGRCPYALGATVFGSEGSARSLAGRINAGVVVINDMIVPTADPRVPFGGRGQSGFGLTRGAEGLLEMTTVKVILERSGRDRPHLHASAAEVSGLARAYLDAAHGRSVTGRVRAFFRLIGGLLAFRRSAPAPREGRDRR